MSLPRRKIDWFPKKAKAYCGLFRNRQLFTDTPFFILQLGDWIKECHTFEEAVAVLAEYQKNSSFRGGYSLYGLNKKAFEQNFDPQKETQKAVGEIPCLAKSVTATPNP